MPETSVEISQPRFPRYYHNETSNPSGYVIPNSGITNTSDMILYYYTGGTWKAIYSLVALTYKLLLETGDALLLENGDNLLLE